MNVLLIIGGVICVLVGIAVGIIGTLFCFIGSASLKRLEAAE